MNKKIICIGGAAVDYKLKTINPLELSTSNPVTSSTTLGGVANNVALNLACLTGNVYLQCVVGNDSDGHRLLAHAQSKGIDTSHSLILENNMTSRYYAVLDQHGELHVALADMKIYDEISFPEFSASWDTWEHNSMVFADTNLSAELLQHLIKLCEKKQLQLCIDPVSTTKAKKLPQSLSGVFLIKPDQHEAAVLSDMTITSVRDCIKAGKIILRKGVQHVIISLGNSGYVIVNEICQEHFPARQVENVVNVSGAGDAFIAGILFRLKQDSTIQQACETGAVAAALTVQSLHTVSDMMASLTLAN